MAKKRSTSRPARTKATAPTLAALATQLSRKKARWRAGETDIARLDDATRKRMLGAVPSAESAALMRAAQAAPAILATPPGFAPAVDWRNYRGGNHVSGVKDQGGCGSCVSFGTTALLESMAHIESSRWIDVSEADSHFCSSHGANCGGWWPDQCLDQAIARGICDEAAFPYASAFPGSNIFATPPVCRIAGDRAQRIVKPTSRIALADPTAVKNHITNVGPVTGCLDVFTDFFSYKTGVYHHVSGVLEGGHCVLVIGYSEADQAWVVKNSWNTTWGQGGFGLISYADMKFGGNFFPMYGATGIKLPQAGWQTLGGIITTEPAAGINKDGRLEAFARGTDNALWHIWQTSPGGAFSGWASLGGIITSTPSVVSTADGRLEVFVRGSDGGLFHRWQTIPNGGWSAWAGLGGVITSDPVAARNANGRIEVFARGTDGALWHIRQLGPQQGWSAWASLGVQFVGTPAVGRNRDGRLEVFMRATSGALVHVWQTSPGAGWSTWASRGGVITSDPAVASNKDGRLEVFARGTDNALWRIAQTAPNNGWGTWASLGGVITTNPQVGANRDGRLEVFVRGTDNALWHIWQTAPGGGWSQWASFGGAVTTDAAVVNNADGRLHLFVRGTDNALWQRWQTAPNNGWN